jgi:hypothetical protein
MWYQHSTSHNITIVSDGITSNQGAQNGIFWLFFMAFWPHAGCET